MTLFKILVNLKNKYTLIVKYVVEFSNYCTQWGVFFYIVLNIKYTIFDK